MLGGALRLCCFMGPCLSGSQLPFSPLAQTTSPARSRGRQLSKARTSGLRATTRSHGTVTCAARGSDPFVAAGSRLESLLSGIGDGEEELLESILSEQTPGFKLALSLLAAGVISSGALALCWLTGADPWGGASLSVHSLTAATLGAAACVPLLMVRAWAWSKEAHDRFPVLLDLKKWQAEIYHPVLNNMTIVQMAVLVCCEVLPSTMLTLPAAQGGLTVSLQYYASQLQEWGVPVPPLGPAAAALAITALLAACARALEHAISEEEYDVVAAAMENADRFYRVTINNRADDTVRDPHSAAEAFKVVASEWLEHRQQACSVLATLAAGEVLFLGCLWRLSSDMAAPLAASIMLTAADFAFVRKMGSKLVR